MMLKAMPAIIFYPIIIVWAVLYGSIAGAFFKIIAVYENWVAINRLQIILWKKYPQRSYQKYISGIWASQIKGKPVELAEYTKHQLEKDNPTEPFPFIRIITNTIFMIFITPFMALSGLIDGPMYVFSRACKKRKLQLGISDQAY